MTSGSHGRDGRWLLQLGISPGLWSSGIPRRGGVKEREKEGDGEREQRGVSVWAETESSL